VQPLATGMDHAELKAEFGNHFIFWGGVNVQKILLSGTPEDVR
jgi:hypothetical protein